MLSPSLATDSYVISRWQLQGEELRATLKPHNRAEQIEVVSLDLGTRYMRLEIRSKLVGWKRIVTLNNEKYWNEGIQRVRNASAQLSGRE